MTEWLDTHREVFKALQEPGVIDLVSRYSAELQPFFERYTENQKKLGTVVQTTTTVWTDDKPDPNQSPEAKSSDEQAASTAKSVELQARIDALEGQLSAAKAESVTLSGQLAAACTRADTAEASNKALTAEREQLAGQVQTLTAEKAALQTECDKAKGESQDLNQRLQALSAGQLPVSSVRAPTETTKGNMMEDARKSKRK
jgi:chromosome segregation ATPase